LNRNYIYSIPLAFPDPVEQKAIACILGALDDKIELNRRRNRTLELTARAIFQSWFVDFDPVKAKVAGRQPEGLPPSLAALFPDTFDDSEQCPIPAGWCVAPLEDVLSVLETGSRPKGGVGGIDQGVPSIGAESVVSIGQFDFAKTKYVPIDFFQKMRKGKCESRDVLLYKDGGKPGMYEPHVSMFGDGFPFEEFCINEHVYRLRANHKLTQSFLYFWLTSELALDEMRVKGTGVAIPGLNSTAVKSLHVLLPSISVVEHFDKLLEPIVSHIFSSCNESRRLGVLRDALLPKLITGELGVPDAERIVARCT
jgi:type I restriction enzyme S subunit